MTIDQSQHPRVGRFRMQILTPAGWTASRRRYRRLKSARKAARWFAALSEVRQVQIVDEIEDRIAFDFTNPRRKPR